MILMSRRTVFCVSLACSLLLYVAVWRFEGTSFSSDETLPGASQSSPLNRPWTDAKNKIGDLRGAPKSASLHSSFSNTPDIVERFSRSRRMSQSHSTSSTSCPRSSSTTSQVLGSLVRVPSSLPSSLQSSSSTRTLSASGTPEAIDSPLLGIAPSRQSTPQSQMTSPVSPDWGFLSTCTLKLPSLLPANLTKCGASAVDIVIARYGVDVNDLNNLIGFLLKPNPGARVFVYDKAEYVGSRLNSTSLGSRVIIRHIPNVGMCDHTYLHHIIYAGERGDLADFTIFIPDTALRSDRHVSKNASLVSLLRKIGPNASRVRAGGVFNAGGWLPDNFTINRWTPGKGYIGPPLILASVRPLRAWLAEFAEPRGVFDGMRLRFSVWGIFGATRGVIQKWPLRMWHRLRDEVGVGKNVEAAHFMERSWFSFLNHP